MQRGAGCRGGGDKRRHRLYRPGGAASDANVAGGGPPRAYPWLAAGGRDSAVDCRYPGAHRRRAGGDAGGAADQPARRAVVPVVDISSGETNPWITTIGRKVCRCGSANVR